MSPKLALSLCLLFIAWLFARSRKQEHTLTFALWIPLIWALIIGSKPISAWLGLADSTASADNYIEGSPFDRLFFPLIDGRGTLRDLPTSHKLEKYHRT